MRVAIFGVNREEQKILAEALNLLIDRYNENHKKPDKDVLLKLERSYKMLRWFDGEEGRPQGKAAGDLGSRRESSRRELPTDRIPPENPPRRGGGRGRTPPKA